jgi:hypothetical protein
VGGFVLKLTDIGKKYDTDKHDGLHDFLTFYERRLSALRDEKFVMYEVGVLRGGSLRTWGEYFSNATIVGIDVNKSCKDFESGNMKVKIGDACDVAFIFDLFNEFGTPKIFLDDGSHRWDHQIINLNIVFPLLAPGGFYIIEDIDTSFQKHLEKAPFEGLSSISAFDYICKFSRVVCGENALGDEKPYDLFMQKYSPWVGSIEIGRRTVVISKKLMPGKGPR